MLKTPGLPKAFFLLAGCATLWAQPSITVVEVNASYALPGYLNSGIAQGSLFAVKGSGFAAPGTTVQATRFPLAKTMADVSVQVTAGGVNIDAYMLYVTEKQVGAILPSSTPKGPAKVTVTNSSGKSNSFPIVVVTRNFGMLTLNEAGTGPVLAQNYTSDSNQPINTLTNPAKPGQVVILWGTGLGAAAGDEAGGPLPGDLHPDVTLLVGNTSAQIMYAGRSGCCAGIDQVSFVVPPDTLGCYVPIVFYHSPLNFRQIPDIAPQSNFGTISISANGEPCTDPTGLSGAEIDQMQRKGSLRTGAVVVERWVPFANNSSSQVTTLAGAFDTLTPNAFLRSQGIFGYPALNTCLTYPVTRNEQAAPLPNLNGSLNAGSSLALVGGARTLEAPRGPGGAYLASSTDFALNPGQYILLNTGGPGDVGPFEVGLSVPAPLQWLNKAAFGNSTIFRTSAIPFQWSGADPSAFVVATILGYTQAGGTYTICTAPASAGSLTLQNISAITVAFEGDFGPFPATFNLGQVMPTVRFTAPGLDAGFVTVFQSDGVYTP